MQPYFLPYLNYFKLISMSDHFFILNDVNFPKKKFINKNSFSSNGKFNWTLPVAEISQNKKINQHYFYDFEMNKKKLKINFYNYFKKHYYYDQNLLDRIFEYNDNKIDLFIKESIGIICDYLYIKTKISFTSDIQDIREKGQDRILKICDRYKATEYLNLPSGINLYNKEEFKKKNIKLSFIPDVLNDDLKVSVLDIIFTYGQESIIKMLRH